MGTNAAPPTTWSVTGHPSEAELAAALVAVRQIMEAGADAAEQDLPRGWPRRVWRRHAHGEES